MAKEYVPNQKIIQKYAELLVKFALNSGKGVQPGEVVQCNVPDVAKPLALALQNVILQCGAHPMIRLMPTGFDRDFYQNANDDQLTFFPSPFLKARTELIDHNISIIADVFPNDLKDVPPEKIMKALSSKGEYINWLDKKENQGKFTWTIGLWGTQAKADEVGLTLKEYWAQIIDACYLDKKDPVKEWTDIHNSQEFIKKTLNDMEIQWLHVQGEDADLHIQLGSDRIWNGGSGRNIPSFEIFTSPNWRGTHGWIRFNQPLYRYGQVIKNVRLELVDGLVTKAEATVGQTLLSEMLKTVNANKLGEYSLTDRRMSRITHVMAETLFDENISGPFGNTHLAIGRSYHDCFRGNPAEIEAEEWAERGFNHSAEHTDIISTTDRTVTATLKSGEKKVIYQDGQFTFYDGK
ncbi:aminopeptidase [soil metagenome]